MVMGQRLCVPDVGDVRKEIMEEAHSSAYAMHPGSTKMYHTLKEHYWWKGMKRDIAEFVFRCLTCQQVKAEHQKPAGRVGNRAGRAGQIVGWAKIGPGQNWPDFFRPKF